METALKTTRKGNIAQRVRVHACFSRVVECVCGDDDNDDEDDDDDDDASHFLTSLLARRLVPRRYPAFLWWSVVNGCFGVFNN